MKKVFQYIRYRYFKWLERNQKKRRFRYAKKKIKFLKNKDFSLFSNNCNGGVVLRDLGVRFNSPFINLNVNPKDYVKYIKNLDYYNSLPLEVKMVEGIDYPIGTLGDLTIEFIHYKTCELAKQKWEERAKRINKDNLFIMLTEQHDCTEEIVREFDKLPYKNKVVFTYRKYEDVKSSIYLEEFKDNPKGVFMFLGFRNK